MDRAKGSSLAATARRRHRPERDPSGAAHADFLEVLRRYDLAGMPIETLGAVYEQLLGSGVSITGSDHRAGSKPDVRHAGGVYYTPRYMVDAIVERTLGPLLEGATPEEALELRIVDPACGAGSFLLGAYRYLVDWHLRFHEQAKDRGRKYRDAFHLDRDGRPHLTPQRRSDILSRCIHGVDLDPQAIEIARMSLHLELLDEPAGVAISPPPSPASSKADRHLPDLSRNLRCGNALLQSRDLAPRPGGSDHEPRRINALDWHDESSGFGEIMRSPPRGGRGGFDAVIGNPPYVRVQELTGFAPVEADLYKQRYESAAEGNYDVYVVFVERSLQLLRSEGRVGFILPTKWWQASYGAPLRRLLASGRHYAETFDFADEQVFEGPTTYTCIALFTKRAAPSLSYHRMSPLALRARGIAGAPALREHTVAWKHLGDETWYPGVRAALRPLFDRLRRQGPFLNDSAVCPRVFQGLKTGLDSVYVLDAEKQDGKDVVCTSRALGEDVVLEAALLHPLVKGREMKRFAPLPPRKLVLFPYERRNGSHSLIPAARLEKDYPKTWEYLRRNKTSLDERERGRWKGPRWYQYSRSQALDVVGRPKLLTADMAARMAFSHDGDGDLYLLGGAAGGYGLLPARPDLVGPLLALLNSALLEWLLRPPGLSSPFRGGWFSCEARFINLLPIRLPSSAADLHTLGVLAQRAVAAYERLNAAPTDRDRALATRRIEAAEAEIDDRVFHLYAVKVEECRAVLEAVAEAPATIGGRAVDTPPNTPTCEADGGTRDP